MITLVGGPLNGQQVHAPGTRTELYACGPVLDEQRIPGPFYCYRFNGREWTYIPGVLGRVA